MRGVLYYGPNDLRFDSDILAPEIKHEDDVLIKIAYCGICGTDLLSYTKGSGFFDKVNQDKAHPLSGKILPMTMGHEMSGTIVQIGSNVDKDKWKVGTKVVIEPTCYCEDKKRWSINDSNSKQCSPCEDGLTNLCDDMGITGLGTDHGGLAEYFLTSSHHLVKVPDWIPLDCAALVQPLSVSYHAFDSNNIKEGSDILIIGGGSIGIGCILAAQAFGAINIVCSEPAKIRRNQAKELGANKIYDPSGKSLAETVKDLKGFSTGGKGFNYVFDCSGFPITFQTGIELCKPRGTLVNLAIWPEKKPIDVFPMDFTKGEKCITGSMCYTIKDFQGVIDAMANGKISLDNVKKLITKKVLLEDAVNGAFEELLNNKDKHIKILICAEKE